MDLKRRDFLKFSAATALIPLFDWQATVSAQTAKATPDSGRACWLDVCAPFVVEDPEAGIHSEIVLTSDSFSGKSGYENRTDLTEYEIYLYDAKGNAIGPGGIAKTLSVPAMRTTVIRVRDLLKPKESFLGGVTVKLRPNGSDQTHASDLFSSAFVRWSTSSSFDNVHANPDPLQWQAPRKFYYSMPFPSLERYNCVFGIFNPYDRSSAGTITIYDPVGEKAREIFYDLKPFRSRFLDLRTGDFLPEGFNGFTLPNLSESEKTKPLNATRGTIAIVNRDENVKAFGYLLIKDKKSSRFSIDHPIHQSPFDPAVSSDPFGADGRFKAKNILYTPLIFRSKNIGGITFNSKLHLSAGASLEENLWLSPFITDSRGEVAWATTPKSDFGGTVAEKQLHRGLIKLGGHQSCMINCSNLGLENNFSGGLSLGVRANTNHTLMKIEVTVAEWGAHAFTHFRPGLFAARNYQKHAHRGGLATDYIVSGSRLKRTNGKVLRDEIVAVINIDDQAIEGNPTLEVFNSSGLIDRIALGKIPPFASCHFLLSELTNREFPSTDLSLRLVDEKTTMLMSTVHIDYERRDIALDHGSDRFSTHGEFGCKLNA